MNIIGMPGSEQSGILEALREESASGQRAGLLSAYTGGTREKASARQSGSVSDSVFISETAMLLASGMLAPGADEAAPLQDDSQDTLGLYSSSGYNTFAQARLAARRARSEAALAGMALLAPLPPGGDDSKGPDGAVVGGNATSSSTSSDAAFAVARLQNRLRDLQRELSALESGDTSDPVKATRVHALTSQINRARQDISGLLHRTQR